MRTNRVPPQAYFVGSAVFHYLGPAFAVLLFPSVGPLGAAWLRIASAAAIFAGWRRPWRSSGAAAARWTVVGLGVVLAVMNTVFYLAIARLPLATVGAIEFLGPVALAAYGLRPGKNCAAKRHDQGGGWVTGGRNLAALVLAVAGVVLLTDVRLTAEPFGMAMAFANCALFVLYVVLGKRIASSGAGIDRLGLSMLVAAVAVTPLGLADAVPAFDTPRLLGAGLAVGVCSSVLPYVLDQLALARLSRAGFALMLSLLPATATIIGLLVLRQVPEPAELAGIALVIAGVAIHHDREEHA
ncbi:MAG TPA: EamA family transporter [Streptosporangiaceae bacterium]